jgi:hypothetical protein
VCDPSPGSLTRIIARMLKPRKTSRREARARVAMVVVSHGGRVYPGDPPVSTTHVEMPAERPAANRALDCVDHEHGPDRKLDRIPVENPVSIAGGSGSYPHRRFHRNLPDNNPVRQCVADDITFLRLSRGQAAVVLLGQPRRTVASAVFRDEVGASGLPLSGAEDDGHLGLMRLLFLFLFLLLLLRLLCRQRKWTHERQRHDKCPSGSFHFLLLCKHMLYATSR